MRCRSNWRRADRAWAESNARHGAPNTISSSPHAKQRAFSPPSGRAAGARIGLFVRGFDPIFKAAAQSNRSANVGGFALSRRWSWTCRCPPRARSHRSAGRGGPASAFGPPLAGHDNPLWGAARSASPHARSRQNRGRLGGASPQSRRSRHHGDRLAVVSRKRRPASAFRRSGHSRRRGDHFLGRKRNRFGFRGDARRRRVPRLGNRQ